MTTPTPPVPPIAPAPTPPIQTPQSPTPPAPPSDPVTPPPVDPNAPPAEPKAPEPTPEFVPLALADIKLPDGIAVDPAIATPFVELVNEHKLPRPIVDKLIDLQTKSIQANSEAGSRAWADMQKQWTAEIEADPELGGAAWAKHEPAIGQMLDKYGSPEVRAALDLTGAGNNPHVVRMFAKIAAAVTEPGFIPSSTPADGQQSVEDRMYPSMKK